MNTHLVGQGEMISGHNPKSIWLRSSCALAVNPMLLKILLLEEVPEVLQWERRKKAAA